MWGRGGRFRGRGDGNRGFNPMNRGRDPSNFQRRNFRGIGRGFDGTGRHKRNIQQRHAFSPGKRLGEVDLGITEYVNKDVKGFDGIIKARYSDFQVNEIDVEGNVAKLTDLHAPEPVTLDKVVIDDQSDLLDKYNTEIIPIEIWNQLNKMSLSSDENYPNVSMDVTDFSKEKRTKVYEAISSAFGQKVSGSTEAKGDKKFIIFSKLCKNRSDRRVRWVYPGEFVHFIVHKENLDTMDAAQIIAQALHLNHVKPTFFGYSGTKDRRAKTSQWFSLRKVEPRRISSCAKRLQNIYIGNFEFKNYHLTLGYLKGNVFRIALRNVTESPDVIDAAVESLKRDGFINYYGLQRFGSHAEIPTYKIGRHLIKGEYRQAVNMILTPQGQYTAQLRCFRETGDPFLALSLFPKHANSIEHKLLTALTLNNKNDLVTVLEKIPRNMRLLYIHSFQSWIWNHCVSERIKRFGFKLQVGDLVTDNLDFDYEISEDYSVGQWVEDDEKASKDDGDENQVQDENEKADISLEIMGRKGSNKYPKVNNSLVVKEITSEDLTEGKYTIYNLVLPLPGYNIQYPSNMKDYYDKLAQEADVDLNVKQKVKTYNLSGTYRKVVIKPHDVSWKHVRYDDPSCDLIVSDWDELTKKNRVKYCDEGKYKALILEFTLGSSTYATMALRELLKHDTSSESQARKNNYYKNEEAEENVDASQSDINEENIEQSSSEKRKLDSDVQTDENKKIKIGDDE